MSERLHGLTQRLFCHEPPPRSQRGGFFLAPVSAALAVGMRGGGAGLWLWSAAVSAALPLAFVSWKERRKSQSGGDRRTPKPDTRAHSGRGTLPPPVEVAVNAR